MARDCHVPAQLLLCSRKRHNRAMTDSMKGSTWKKWDLHVHTPESLIQHYPGGKAGAWDAFLSDLEELPPEFKVIGINDYIFVDGYERILKEKESGRLENIDLFLPVVELRLDKFGGGLLSAELMENTCHRRGAVLTYT
jgi:hypothetical protein